jgi:hypothetical protein
VSFATDLSQFVASKVKLARLLAIPQRHDTSASPTSPPPPTPSSSSDGPAVS